MRKDTHTDTPMHTHMHTHKDRHTDTHMHTHTSEYGALVQHSICPTVTLVVQLASWGEADTVHCKPVAYTV